MLYSLSPGDWQAFFDILHHQRNLQQLPVNILSHQTIYLHYSLYHIKADLNILGINVVSVTMLIVEK